MPDETAAKQRRHHHQDPQINRSLLRGIEILRAFKPGADLMGNGDLAERTGLSKAVISRLTQTLVEAGLLEHERTRRAYRLAAPLLSFAHAMRSGSPVLNEAAPLMRKMAESLRVNVGLAVADRDEMVYLESIRYNRRVSLRNVVAGQRVPMELTSLGHANLAAAPEAQRRELLALFKARRAAGWSPIRDAIRQSAIDIQQKGYCMATWQPEVVALATPLTTSGPQLYVINTSVTTSDTAKAVERMLRAPLLELAAKVSESLARLGG